MRLGIDLDGVLYDFGDSVRRYLNSIGRTYGFKDDHPEPHTWNFYEYWGMDLPEFKKICDDGVDAGYVFCGPARPGAVEAVTEVYEAGHDLIVITDRSFGRDPKNSQANTLEWWESNGFPPFDEIVFSSDKTCVSTDIFIEDKLENYDKLIAAGTPCFLINRAWNFVPGGDGRTRIDDISEYPALVEQMAQDGVVDLSLV